MLVQSLKNMAGLIHSSMVFLSRSAETNTTEEQKHGIFVHYPLYNKVIVHFSRTVLLFFLSVSGRVQTPNPRMEEMIIHAKVVKNIINYNSKK